MKHYLTFFFAICLLSVFLVVNTTDAGRKTRDLVFEEEEESAPVKKQADKPAVVAVKTSIELTRDGKKSTVLPDQEFKSGDKVKFIYTTNIDAYVYWLSQGTSGDYSMLFPSPKTGTDNLVKKNDIYTIPVKGNFKFDEKPGVEKILLVLSSEKISELEEAAKEAAAKNGKITAEAASVDNVTKKTESKRKTRDLVFEEEEDEEAGIQTSSQAAKDTKQPFYVYYELVHK